SAISACSARVVSTRTRCSSSAWLPRTPAPTSEPIDAIITASTAMATTTSMSVKPAVPAALERVKRRNFDASREPVDADLIADAEAGERDHAAARHAGGEEHDGRAGVALVAASGKRRVELDVGRQHDE